MMSMSGGFAVRRRPRVFRCRRYSLPLGSRTYLMGILNVTPDSFSDGGRYLDQGDALRQAEVMLAAGADLIDIGGESTRPGSQPVSAEEEMNRILPVVRALVSRLDCPVSVDTAKSAVARAALAEGADIINDVTGLQQDPAIAVHAAEAGAGLVIMHNARLYRNSESSGSTDLISDVRSFFLHSIRLAHLAGLTDDQLVLDPGIGFGISTEESLAMIRYLDAWFDLGLPLLVGPSHKRFIGEVLDVPVGDRLLGTAAAVAVSIARGADFVRVHDVRDIHTIVRMTDALVRDWPVAGGVS